MLPPGRVLTRDRSASSSPSSTTTRHPDVRTPTTAIECASKALVAMMTGVEEAHPGPPPAGDIGREDDMVDVTRVPGNAQGRVRRPMPGPPPTRTVVVLLRLRRRHLKEIPCPRPSTSYGDT